LDQIQALVKKYQIYALTSYKPLKNAKLTTMIYKIFIDAVNFNLCILKNLGEIGKFIYVHKTPAIKAG
jgi:hypothetical protein